MTLYIHFIHNSGVSVLKQYKQYSGACSLEILCNDYAP